MICNRHGILLSWKFVKMLLMCCSFLANFKAKKLIWHPSQAEMALHGAKKLIFCSSIRKHGARLCQNAPVTTYIVPASNAGQLLNILLRCGPHTHHFKHQKPIFASGLGSGSAWGHERSRSWSRQKNC